MRAEARPMRNVWCAPVCEQRAVRCSGRGEIRRDVGEVGGSWESAGGAGARMDGVRGQSSAAESREETRERWCVVCGMVVGGSAVRCLCNVDLWDRQHHAASAAARRVSQSAVASMAVAKAARGARRRSGCVSGCGAAASQRELCRRCRHQHQHGSSSSAPAARALRAAAQRARHHRRRAAIPKRRARRSPGSAAQQHQQQRLSTKRRRSRSAGPAPHRARQAGSASAHHLLCSLPIAGWQRRHSSLPAHHPRAPVARVRSNNAPSAPAALARARAHMAQRASAGSRPQRRAGPMAAPPLALRAMYRQAPRRQAVRREEGACALLSRIAPSPEQRADRCGGDLRAQRGRRLHRRGGGCEL